MKKFFILILFVSLILSSVGLTYLLFLQLVFPKLVPSYGGGETISLNSYNNYTFQLPWKANSRLHLSFQTDNTVKLYLDGNFLCDCTSYQFIVEPGDTALIKLEANSNVSGRFKAWQEIPAEKQKLALIIIIVGLIGATTSMIAILLQVCLKRKNVPRANFLLGFILRFRKNKNVIPTHARGYTKHKNDSSRQVVSRKDSSG